MPLILQPTFSDKTREEIEQHLLAVRARRMAAVVMYYAGMNAKTMHLIAHEQARIAREYSYVKRDLEKIDKLERAVEDRLNKLGQHMQELSFHRDNLVEMEDGTSTEASPNGKDRVRNQGGIRYGRPPGS